MMIIQFHDGQMIRQRVIKPHMLTSVMRDLKRCGIDMGTFIATNRFAADFPIGYLNHEYPLVGHRTRGLWENQSV
jgi:hypothetical protein